MEWAIAIPVVSILVVIFNMTLLIVMARRSQQRLLKFLKRSNDDGPT